MATCPVCSTADDQLDGIEEFAGENIRQAIKLANRYGYNNPSLANMHGDLYALRFRRSSRLHVITTLTLK